MTDIVWKNTTASVNTLKNYDKNPRKLSAEGLDRLKRSITEDGYHAPIIVDTDMVIVAGHQRLRALKELGAKEVDVRIASRKLTAEEFDRINLRDNVSVGIWDTDILLERFDMPFLADMGLPMDIFGEAPAAPAGGGNDGNTGVSLADRFLVPPFSVLDARQGYWQDRKRGWAKLGIQSELGRDELATTVVATDWMKRGPDAGGSIFDPVLCELAYRWFSPMGGTVLDCFAGGSVRGVVAALLERQYVGVELRGAQVEANRAQWLAIQQEYPEAPTPVWHQGDSIHIARHAQGVQADLLFSCPPYADLEVYSNDPADISQMKYPEFLAAYRTIIKESCNLLKADRFAVFVVGEVRGKGGGYVNFVADTIQAFLDAGLTYYNEAILVTPVGSLPLRAGRQFAAGRKFGKTHQNVLVFVKGDAKRAADACGIVDVEVGAPDEGESAESLV